MIKIENLTYKYSVGTPFEKVAVDNVNLEIEGGEVIGVIGHTGSGKSTLIQHLNGLLKPTSGKIYLDGMDIWADKSKLRQVRFDVGLVFQYPEYQLFEETVYKDIAFGPKNMGLTEKEIDYTGSMRPRNLPASGRNCCRKAPLSCPAARSGGWLSPGSSPWSPRC